MIRPLRHLALTITCALLPSTSFAQAPVTDIIRGRVTDDSSRAVVEATVFVTRGPDRALQQAKTDSSGRYRVVFENGTGDYLVAVSAPGLKAARRRVQRVGDERELVADFVLSFDMATLAAVKVTATKPERAYESIDPFNPETGASEKWSDGVEGRVPPSLAGNLSALIGTIPGITLGAGGASLLGSSSESNLTTLNGMSLGVGSLPRAARTETRITGATFDPTRGGFSGTNMDVRLEAGDRNYQQRNAFFTIDAPSLQFTDQIGRLTGARLGSFRGSAGADGELVRQTLTYNVALDVARSSSDPATLASSNATLFQLAGLSSDSVARLLDVSRALNLPFIRSGIPSAHNSTGVTWLGRLDDIRDSLKIRTLTTYLGSTTDGAQGFTTTATPSTASERRVKNAGVQLHLGDYWGEAKHILNQTRLSWNSSRTENSAYLALPEAQVLMRSGSAGQTGDISSASLGGGGGDDTRDTRWTVEGSNETIWNARGWHHKFKAFAWARSDGLSATGGGDLLGRYTFASIEDFARNRPSSFSRTLNIPNRDGKVWNAAGAFAHQYAPSRYFSLLYGARLEADGFIGTPARNESLEQSLGIRSGLAPSRLHVSPRMGFSWTYNRDKDNGNGMNVSATGRFYRNTSGVIRGGIGEFRDLLRPDLLADASARTGLPGGVLSLNCVGAAAPTPDWSNWLGNPLSVPNECIDGTGPLGESAPYVQLIGRNYDVPRSWRASLDWNGNVGPWTIKLGGLASYDLSQPGAIDANFAAAQRFALGEEGNRPVYVSTASIDAPTASVSAAESRRVSTFGRVNIRTSDLRGYGGQITTQIMPDLFKLRRVRGSPFVSLAYTLQSARREYRGFDGAAFGDPRAREWAPAATDARHMFVLQGGFYTVPSGAVTLFARAQSGLPFSPIVQGDVNGDGRFGDRAFIPSLSSQSDPNTSAQLQRLLASGSEQARACLRTYAGQVAPRNGCRGPWTASLNAQWRPTLPKALSGRVNAIVYLQNVLGGVDQLLHGADNVRGWGSLGNVDPVLLVPRSFDPTAQRFHYDVNPRFADARPATTLARNPFRISIDISLRLSTDYDLQELRRALEPVRVKRAWERRSADSLAAFYLNNTSDIHRALLEESDSLFLSKEQIIALKRVDSVFVVGVRAIFVPLGNYLTRFSDGKATQAALDTVSAARKAYWKLFWLQPEIADSLLTPLQRNLFPMLQQMVETPKRDREHSQWNFGSPVGFRDREEKRR